MEKDKMKKARRKTKRKRIKNTKLGLLDRWRSSRPCDGRNTPNIRKRSSHTTNERKALLQRVTTVTHLWRPSRAWRWTLCMDWDVGVKGRLVLPLSTESPIFLPPLLVLLYFLHEDFIKNSKTADFSYAIYMSTSTQFKGRRNLLRVNIILFYSYFPICLFWNSVFIFL